MNLIGLIKSKTREKILRFFFSNQEKRYYLRELERILSFSVGNIRRELIFLEKLGLFKREKIGNLIYYSLDKKSSFFEVVENIISKTANKKRDKEFKIEFEKGKNTNLIVIKKDYLDLLFSKMSELENILKNLSQKKSEVEDFLNLGIVINDRKEVLLVRRLKQEKGKNGSVLTWSFPGGKQRINESRSECVIRGVLAETGYKVKSIKEISFRFHPQYPVFIVYHFCRLVSQKPVAKPVYSYEISEIGEIRWVKPKEIKKLITTNLDLKVAKNLGLK